MTGAMNVSFAIPGLPVKSLFPPSKTVEEKFFNNSVRTFYIMEMIINWQRVRESDFFFFFP